MGLFGFFRKKKKSEDMKSGFSSRRRRIITSSTSRSSSTRRGRTRAAEPQPSSEEVKPEPAETTPVGPAVQEAEQKPDTKPAEVPPAQQVGSLKRGKSSALLSQVESDEADAALKDFIVEMGLGDPEETEAAFSRKDKNNPFIKILVQDNIINENELLAELSKKCMIPQGKLEKYRIRKKALECIDPDLARQLMVLPVDKLGQILSVAIVNPLSTEAVKTLSRVTGLRVKTVVCTYSEFIEHYTKHYTPSGQIEGSEETVDVSVEEPQPISPEEFRKSIQAARDKTEEKPPKKAASTEVRQVAKPGADRKEDTEEIEEAEVAEVAVPPSFSDIDDVIEDKDITQPDEAALEEVLTAEEERAEKEFQEKLADMEAVQPFGDEEELLIEPIIEGIDISGEEEEEKLIIEPIIIEASVSEGGTAGGDGEFIDALPVVEEEFRQGITLGAIDLFSKWEKLHTRKRIITLHRTPDEVFDFLQPSRNQ